MPVDDLTARVRSLMPQAWDDLKTLVSYQSVADPRVAPAEECHKAARHVADLFTAAGIPDMRLIDQPDGHQAVYGHRPAPPGAPTVLYYSHYDVQPPMDASEWTSPAWTLTERDGRWYGRGASDCKGNIVMQLTALRALDPDLPIGIKILCEGSEEQSTGGLAALVRSNPELVQADTIMVCDVGNAEVGLPTVTTDLRGVIHATVTVRALSSPMHSGSFGGPTPDALNALIHMLATLHDANGDTTITGIDNTGTWGGVAYSAEQFRKDANVLPGVDLLGTGAVADMLWARPALTVIGIDVPPVVGAIPAIQRDVTARLNLRLPYGVDVEAAWQALQDHLRAAAPWHVQVDVDLISHSLPFRTSTEGPAFALFAQVAAEAFGRELTTAGQGGSIPTCHALRDVVPKAEILLVGVEEPQCLIHSPNESVDPGEIERMAVAQALFLAATAAN